MPNKNQGGSIIEVYQEWPMVGLPLQKVHKFYNEDAITLQVSAKIE